jgi:hypothetical protein
MCNFQQGLDLWYYVPWNPTRVMHGVLGLKLCVLAAGECMSKI